MDFLNFYTDSLNEELGTGAGFAAKIDRIGRHPEKHGDTPNSAHIGLPKDVWNINPSSSWYNGKSYNPSSYIGSRKNYEKLYNIRKELNNFKKDIVASLKQAQKDQTSNQPIGTQQVQQQAQNDQTSNQPIGTQQAQNVQPQIITINSSDEYFELQNEYDDLVDNFSQFMDMTSVALKKPELTHGELGSLNAAYDMMANGILNINKLASQIYNKITNEKYKQKFSQIHKSFKSIADVEYDTLKKARKKYMDILNQKKLEIEKQKQDAEIQSKEQQVEPEPEFQEDQPEQIVTNKDKINNIIKKNAKDELPDAVKDIIKQVRELNPDLDSNISDTELWDMIKAQNDAEREQQSASKAESISFSEFYALNEAPGVGRQGWDPHKGGTISRMVKGGVENQANSGYMLNRLAGRGMKKLMSKMSNVNWKKQKQLVTDTITEFPHGLGKDKFFSINYQLYMATNAACGKSLTEYRTYAKENGLNAAKKLAKGFIMVYQRDSLEIEDDILQNIQQLYKFKEPIPNTLNLMEGTIWRTSNSGMIVTLQLIVNEEKDSQDTVSHDRATISQDEKDNILYFVGCDAKGLEFFADNFNMSFRQYLQSARTVSTDEILNSMGQNLQQAVGTSKPTTPVPASIVYAKQITDKTKIAIVKTNIYNFIQKHQNDIYNQERINNQQIKDGMKVIFNNGDSIMYAVTYTGNLIVNISDNILKNYITSIDPDGQTEYKKV